MTSRIAGVKTLGASPLKQNLVRVNDAGEMAVSVLGVPTTARQVNATASSANQPLTEGVTKVSIYARNADIRYSVGTGTQTAGGASHFIASGERLDISLPDVNPNIAAIRAGGTDGVLEITELA